MKGKKITLIAAALACVFSFAACGKPETETPRVRTEYSYSKESSTMMKFTSSDTALDGFLNDYLHRHLRYDDYRAGPLALGNSVMFNKEWEAMSLFFFDTTSAAVPDDRVAMMERFLYDIPVDRFGYTWQSFDVLQSDKGTAGDSFGQGWPFPDYHQSRGYSQGWEFNDDASNAGWETYVNGGDLTDETFATGGLLRRNLESAEFTEFVSPMTQINSYHAPFLNIDLRLVDSEGLSGYSNFDDVYIYWQTAGDVSFSEEKMVKQSEFATLPTSVGSNWNKNLYFPMYLHPEWGTNRTVTRIKIEIRSKAKTPVNGLAMLNYVRASYDTRHTNNGELLLRAAKLHYEFTGKADVLQDNLVRYRKALLFLLEHCGGKAGLINMEYFVGHEGALRTEIGASIGQGYWDLISMPNYSLYSNIYFYKAVESMLYLEKMAGENGITAEMPLVASKNGLGSVNYEETVETLSALLIKTRDALRADINKADKTGFWDPETGRFIEGFNKNGDVVDYGFIMFNLEAVTAGIATDAQAKSIMDWVNGDRIVQQDAQPLEQNYASGKTGTALQADGSLGSSGTLGIYDFGFAPRSTTKKNSQQYYWAWSGDNKFGNQVQDGGADMYVSYYDLMSRISTRGADDAFGRLKEIQAWYNKVQAVNQKLSISDPLQFYRTYYRELNIPMQGNGTPGGIGIDAEFLESAILYSAIPFGFFGIGSEKFNTLNIAPALPDALDWWKIENLAFCGVVYDLGIGTNFAQIDYVRGDTTGLTADIKLDKPEGSFGVYVDGAAVSPAGYKEEGGRIIVNVPLRAVRVEVK